MKEITVEGFKVMIERGETGCFVLSVPELPGCIGQVDKEEDAPAEMKKLIKAHLVELAGKLPKPRSKPEQAETGNRQEKKKRNLN